MRWVAVEIFENLLAQNNLHINKIAIVGGSSMDPEVAILREAYPDSEINYFGVDNYGQELNWDTLDLNQISSVDKKHNLVVCCQVLEHVWNQSAAFENIRSLTMIDGLVWINCPASNIAHGSPEYFSAGYSPDYLATNMINNGFELLAKGAIGSKRNYFATHLLRLWATPLEHAKPLLGYRVPKPITKGKLFELVKRVPGRIMMRAWKPTISNDIDFATESYFFGRLIGHS